ncbi:MAG: hypothetical protein Q4F97_03720 [Bacteroidales bacterium]|nr:hypothetical protein [Bacteroidales bacterium]
MFISTFYAIAKEREDESFPFNHHQLKRECIELSNGVFAFVGYSSSNFG